MDRTHQLLRAQSTLTLSQASQYLAGPQAKRWAIVIGAPQLPSNTQTAETVLTPGASTATTGVKSSFTVPASINAMLTSASMFGTTGTTQVCALQVKRGANTINVMQGTGSATFTGQIALEAGDIVQWNCTTAVAASVTDFTLSVTQDTSSQRVTISFTDPAVLDQGINLYPGGPPLVLLYDHVGQAIREAITAIAASGTPSISIVDIFE